MMQNSANPTANIRSLKAEGMLLLMTVIWGGTFIFTKIGLEESSPFLYLSMRFFIALMISAIVFNKQLTSISKDTIKSGAILGALFASGFILQTYALEYTTISKTAFITGLTVVFTPFAFKLIQKKGKVLFWSKIGVVVAFSGLYIFTNPTFESLNLGDGLTLLSTLFWATYITFMDMFTKGKDSKAETAQLVTMQFVICAPVMLLGYLFYDGGNFSEFGGFSERTLYSLLYNAILASFFLTLIHTFYQRHTTPVKAAIIFSLEPVFASLIAVMFINELLTTRETIGAIIMMSGALVSELGGIISARMAK